MTRARDIANLAGAADAGTVAGHSLIINGDMSVAQRGTSFANPANGTYLTDRFVRYKVNDGAVTYTQSTTAPDNFTHSLKADVTTADTSIGATQTETVAYKVEAQDLQHLNYGASSARTITLSFWVRSNKTGDYAVNILQSDAVRHYTQTYTINTADTWEYKTITYSGDTGGTINNDNGSGFEITFFLTAGSTYTAGSAMSGWEAYSNGDYAVGHNVNILDSTSNEWYLTGVKLEVGDTATPFQHLSYGDNLQQCQRYFFKTIDNMWFFRLNGSTDYARISYPFPTAMRATPSYTGTITGSFSSSGTQYLSSQTIGIFANSPTGVIQLNSGATFDAEL